MLWINFYGLVPDKSAPIIINTLIIKVPNFSVTDQDGNTITMQDYQDKKVIVFFYPAASTPGCTAEACNLRDYYKDLQDKGYEIIGVSADTEKKQSNFRNKYEFPFPLLRIPLWL